MRTLLAISLFMSICQTCTGRCTRACIPKTEIGVDIGAVINQGALGIHVGHRITKQWSLEGTHTLMAARLIRKPDKDEEVHYGEVDSYALTARTDTTRLMSGGISLKYWFNETYKGGFIMIGGRYGGLGGADGILGIGYSINLWKGMTCAISYEIDLRGSAIREKPAGKGIGFTLSYTY